MQEIKRALLFERGQSKENIAPVKEVKKITAKGKRTLWTVNKLQLKYWR